MRIRVRHMVFLVAAALLAGCSAGSSAPAKSRPVTTSPSSAGTTARARARATARPSRGLLGVLPVPAGATPWPTNTNALMSLDSFVRSAYSKSYWTVEEALDTRRGFAAAVEQGWGNADGSQQSIALVRFATPVGAMSAFNEANSGRGWSKAGDDAVRPRHRCRRLEQSDAGLAGRRESGFYAAIGDTMISVFEYTAATPDPADAKALLQRQYESLKNSP